MRPLQVIAMVAIRGGYISPRFGSFKPQKLTLVNVVTGGTGRHKTAGKLQAKTATCLDFAKAGIIFWLNDGGHHFCRLFSRKKT
jgi:hypothetical protein